MTKIKCRECGWEKHIPDNTQWPERCFECASRLLIDLKYSIDQFHLQSVDY